MVKEIFQNKFIINSCKTLFFFLHYFCSMSMFVIIEYFTVLGVGVYYNEDDLQSIRGINEVISNSQVIIYSLITISWVVLLLYVFFSSRWSKNFGYRIAGAFLAGVANILMYDSLIPCILEGSLFAPVFLFAVLSTIAIRSFKEFVPIFKSDVERICEHKKDS